MGMAEAGSTGVGTGGGVGGEVVALATVLCMALNVNGLHMWERGRGKKDWGRQREKVWRAGRKLTQLYVRARREGWALMVLSETHCSLEELKAMTAWWEGRGYRCYGTPGVHRDKRIGGGVLVVWKPEEVRMEQATTVVVSRAIKVQFRWVRSDEQERLLGCYMPVRFGNSDTMVKKVWEQVIEAGQDCTISAGDLNAEGSDLRRGKDNTKADDMMDEMLEDGWRRVGGRAHTYRYSTIDHWLVKGDRGWEDKGLVEGHSGEGDHKTLLVGAQILDTGRGEDRKIKLPMNLLKDKDWIRYQNRVDQEMRQLGITGTEGLGWEMRGKEGLEVMEKVQLRVAEGVLEEIRGKRGKGRSAEGFLEEHKRWTALREWVESREQGDSVFETLSGRLDERGRWKGCRLGYDRDIRSQYSRGICKEDRQVRIMAVCARKVKQLWARYQGAREHSWDEATKRLRAAKGKGGSVVLEAFKIVKQRASGGVNRKMSEILVGGEVVEGLG